MDCASSATTTPCMPPVAIHALAFGFPTSTRTATPITPTRSSGCAAAGATPHGWKNKALLVNLNDVGPEAGQAPGTQVRNNTTAGYTQAPYYLNAMLKVRNFKRSGQWTESDCGSAGAPGNGQSGRDWMRDSSENCKNPP